MFREVAAFELRYQLKSPVFWVTFLIFALLTFGAVASDNKADSHHVWCVRGGQGIAQ